MFEFPEPLWEAHLQTKRKKLCLVCSQEWAVMALRGDNSEIVPICKGCSADWNFYGYEILKRIKPKRLITRTLWFKLKHPFSCSLWDVWKDVQGLQKWVKKMRKWIK